ncbi:MAG: long-chain fatty acid--CoA ligase [Alphaproteobacteria bacterium]|nr:long-chain fatty acid--CoA ligase [Alphaproteobacteria bacterium]
MTEVVNLTEFRDLAGVERFIASTAPRLLLARARATPDRIAMRDKHLGVYQGYTWRDYRDIVEEVALGLAALGMRRGDRVALMGDPCVEWVFADLAVMALGGITVGVYPTSAPVEVEHVVKDSGASIFIAETQEHLDKLLGVIDRLPDIGHVIVIDTRSLFLFEHPLLSSFDELRRRGRTRKAEQPTFFETAVAEGKPEDPAAIVYTSGTTGPPKGAILSHRNMLAGVASYIQCRPEVRHRPFRTVAHLPLSHIVARVINVMTPLATQLVPFFCEEIDEFTETVREVAPDLVIMPPRFYEKFAAQLLVGLETSTPVKKLAYRLAERIGRRVVVLRRAGRPVPPPTALGFWLARQLVFRHLLEKVGLHRVRLAHTGSAPMPPQVVQVWQTWGVDLRDVYGVTEACGISVGQFKPFSTPGDIGQPLPLPGYEIKLSDKNELLLRSPMVFQGYWNNPVATAEVLDAEGWYHTGDVVERVADGAIKLVDRMKDIIVTLGGKTLSPQQIEKVVRGSPFISEAVVFGDGRRYVTALLELDFTSVSEWARTYRIPYTSYTNLVTRPEVVELVRGEVKKANEFLARVEQVKEFRIIPVELDPEEGETTPTRKIKRGLMYRMFRDLVEVMYADQSAALFDKDVPARGGAAAMAGE